MFFCVFSSVGISIDSVEIYLFVFLFQRTLWKIKKPSNLINPKFRLASSDSSCECDEKMENKDKSWRLARNIVCWIIAFRCTYEIFPVPRHIFGFSIVFFRFSASAFRKIYVSTQIHTYYKARCLILTFSIDVYIPLIIAHERVLDGLKSSCMFP